MVKDQSYNRRIFIRKAALATSMVALSGPVNSVFPRTPIKSNPTRISQLTKPVAIAMWDYSWILRHHRYGDFENWDRVLEELAERGYNAIRIDAMPQYVAADSNGEIRESFRSVKNDWKPALWGNDYTMSFQPREALTEFLPKCRKYGIRVGLASWFLRHGTDRQDIFLEEGGLMRAWDETLSFLDSHDLLHDVLYIDLLNEYPNWHGYDWFKNEMNARSNVNKFKLDNPDANVPPEDLVAGNSRYNALQQEFYNRFIQSLITALKEKYPTLEFFASLDSAMNLKEIDLSTFDALDYHIWFEHSGKIPGMNEIRSRDQSLDYRKVYTTLINYWEAHKTSLIDWMDGRIGDIAQTASTYNIVCGNTEGWGPILWLDHPELNWKWVKESAEICVDMALKHESYKFICTSNFTHPQFKGMWEDVNWHRKITSRIKSASLSAERAVRA
jgi:hypothetical protein